MITVTGIIRDFEGNPIEGAHIYTYDPLTEVPKVVKVSDIDGKFQIQATLNENLKVSFVGFKDYYLQATPTKQEIILIDNQLDEIEVIGTRPTTENKTSYAWLWILLGFGAVYYATKDKKQPLKVKL